MDDLLKENGQKLLSPMEEDEEMEVTMTTPLANVIVTPNNADMQTHREEPGDVQTHLTTSPSSESVCKTVDCDEEDSDDSYSDSSSSSSSPSSSSSSSSSPSIPVFEDDDDEGFSQPTPIKTRDEVLLEELPAVEELCITLPEEAELQPVGTVSSILQQLVIIQSLKDTPPLNDGSILFKSDKLAVGKVFEVFGPVSSPLYIMRFNSADQIINMGLTEGLTLYYAPAIKEYTEYILTQQLKLLKGSDASWKNDQEPPEEALDYSDDEKEQEAKRKVKNAKKKRSNNNTDNPANITQSILRKKPNPRGFPPRHAGPPSRHHDSMNNPPPFRHSDISPMYLPPPCPYPPPPSHFPPPNFSLYSPPPPYFFNPSFYSPLWPPNSVPFSDLPPSPHPPPPL